MRLTCLLASLLGATVPALAQSPAKPIAKPGFTVTSVVPSGPDVARRPVFLARRPFSRDRCDRQDSFIRIAYSYGRRGPLMPAPDQQMRCGVSAAAGTLRAAGVDMAQLVIVLSSLPSVSRKVTDRTGLAGRWDVDLQWAPMTLPLADGSPAPDASTASTSPSIFTAVREQLGLKLEPERAPVEVWFVERAELPDAN